MNKDPHRYDDIISLPRHVSENRKHMPLRERAAQFSPFAALSGYDEAIRETARLTENKKELSDEDREALDRKLRLLSARIAEHPKVRIIRFVSDERKEGGRTVEETVILKRVDPAARVLLTQDRKTIPIDDILDIDDGYGE